MGPRRVTLTPAAFERLVLASLIALVFVIVTGGAVRLSGSGLGCPQWPTCAANHVVAPDSFHPMVEFLNRVVTGAVSVAIILVAVGAFVRVPRRRDLTWLSMALASGLVAEIVLGGETVKHRLNPAFVMSHFLLSILLVWVAAVLHHRSRFASSTAPPPLVDREIVWLSRLVVVVALLTVVLGTIVTGAGPHSGANSTDGAQVARWQLNLHDITRLHGTSAMLLVAVSAAMLWVLRSQGAPAIAVQRAYQMISVLGLQVVVGYTQYFLGVPVGLVAIHILGASLVWLAALRLALVLNSGSPAVVPAPWPATPVAVR